MKPKETKHRTRCRRGTDETDAALAAQKTFGAALFL